MLAYRAPEGNATDSTRHRHRLPESPQEVRLSLAPDSTGNIGHERINDPLWRLNVASEIRERRIRRSTQQLQSLGVKLNSGSTFQQLLILNSLPERRASKRGAIRDPYRKVRPKQFPIGRFSC